jgi:ribosome-binding factor A
VSAPAAVNLSSTNVFSDMSNRTLRVNELVQREISDILRKRYQSEAVAITITEVRVAPDLRDARVFVSIVGDESTVEEKLRWLRAHAPEIREEVGRRIVLKYLPKFDYVLDRSASRGSRILQLLDEIERPRDSTGANE